MGSRDSSVADLGLIEQGEGLILLAQLGCAFHWGSHCTATACGSAGVGHCMEPSWRSKHRGHDCLLPASWLDPTPESRALSVLNLASSHTPFALPFLLCRLHSRTWPRGPSHSTPHCKPMRTCRVQHRVEMW